MTEHGDQILNAFESHEHLAPDAAAVHARALELARSYRRRRIGAQAAGGAVLSAGLVAGGLNLPTLLHGGQAQSTVIQAAAGGAPAPAVASSPAPLSKEVERQLAAYFGAGYGLQDAEKLAKIWKMPSTPEELTQVKAEAGRRLLAHEEIPVKPAPTEEVSPEDLASINAFFAAGYNYDDAKTLAKLWKTADPFEAKVLAGQKLEDGKKLPIKPSPEGIADAKEAAALNAYFAAGYDFEDAQKLAKLWKIKDTTKAKVLAGQRLLDGKKLPIKATPDVDDGKDTAAVEAFFKAGYDFDDAVELSKLWKTSDPYEAKVLGGQKLLAGQELPIKP